MLSWQRTCFCALTLFKILPVGAERFTTSYRDFCDSPRWILPGVVLISLFTIVVIAVVGLVVIGALVFLLTRNNANRLEDQTSAQSLPEPVAWQPRDKPKSHRRPKGLEQFDVRELSVISPTFGEPLDCEVVEYNDIEDESQTIGLSLNGAQMFISLDWFSKPKAAEDEDDYIGMGSCDWVPHAPEDGLQWLDMVAQWLDLEQPHEVSGDDSIWFKGYGPVLDERGRRWQLFAFECGNLSSHQLLLLVDEQAKQAQWRMGSAQVFWPEMFFDIAGWLTDRQNRAELALGDFEDVLIQTKPVQLPDDLERIKVAGQGVVYLTEEDDGYGLYHQPDLHRPARKVTHLDASYCLIAAHELLVAVIQHVEPDNGMRASVLSLWDLSKDMEIERLEPIGEAVGYELAFSEDGQYIAVEMFHDMPSDDDDDDVDPSHYVVFDLSLHEQYRSDVIKDEHSLLGWYGDRIWYGIDIEDPVTEHWTQHTYYWDLQLRQQVEVPQNEFVSPGSYMRCWYASYGVHFEQHGQHVDWTYMAKSCFEFMPQNEGLYWLAGQYLVMPFGFVPVLDTQTGQAWMMFEDIQSMAEHVIFVEDVNEHCLVVSNADDEYFAFNWMLPHSTQQDAIRGSAW